MEAETSRQSTDNVRVSPRFLNKTTGLLAKYNIKIIPLKKIIHMFRLINRKPGLPQIHDA
jgi:hypothetical protein